MEKFFVTTSIAYTNAPPHIGFSLELLQADVLARYNSLLGRDVFFLTGTDEHGIKIERAAKKAQKTPEEFTDEIAGKFKELTKALNISNSDFIRTTDRQKHWPTVERVWEKLFKKGDIEKRKYKGLYCIGCEAFLKERDLAEGKCPIHKKKPELVEEENYFFKLSKYVNDVKEEIEKDNINIIPKSKKNEILKFIEQGVEDISVSRSKKSLKWGIPVPGDENQIIYVWFEALINYFYPENYWPANIQCIGKDIFRFHSLMWPAMLFALGLKRPKNILVHGFINVDGQKISKSLGNIVSPFELVDKFGTDAVRYFLLREIPPTQDGDFTYTKFEERYNSDLASGIGNLVARVLKLSQDKKIEPKNTNNDLKIKIKETEKNYKKLIEKFKFNEALASIWELISFCDKYIETEKPWETKDKKVIENLLYAIYKISDFIEPFLPETSEKIKTQLKEKNLEPLFPRI